VLQQTKVYIYCTIYGGCWRGDEISFTRDGGAIDHCCCYRLFSPIPCALCSPVPNSAALVECCDVGDLYGLWGRIARWRFVIVARIVWWRKVEWLEYVVAVDGRW
jgi:hypothetical protein